MEKNKNIDNFLKLVSNEKSGWLEMAKWEIENEDWLHISFSIAVNILSELRSNEEADIYPRNQKELSEAMNCSAQYINKILHGKENLQIETICKFQRVLGIKLIQVPNDESPQIDLNSIEEPLSEQLSYKPLDNFVAIPYPNPQKEVKDKRKVSKAKL